jgi:3',5'-cyclic AMP phosphodiesterase CpdA
MEMPNKFLIVHLTDLHLSTKVTRPSSTPFTHKIIISGFKLHRPDLYNSEKFLIKTVELLNNEIKPNLVLITGDIADDNADTKAYHEAFNELQKLNSPYFVVLGDHDIAEDGTINKEQIWFKTEPFSEVVHGYKIIGLPPFPDNKDIDWLKNELDNSKETEVIICYHRMLKASFLMKLLSKLYCPTLLSPKSKELLQLFSQYDNIRLVLTGHSHTNYVFDRKHARYITTSSLAEYPFEMRLIWVDDKNIKTKVYSIFKKGEKRQWIKKGL